MCYSCWIYSTSNPSKPLKQQCTKITSTPTAFRIQNASLTPISPSNLYFYRLKAYKLHHPRWSPLMVWFVTRFRHNCNYCVKKHYWVQLHRQQRSVNSWLGYAIILMLSIINGQLFWQTDFTVFSCICHNHQKDGINPVCFLKFCSTLIYGKVATYPVTIPSWRHSLISIPSTLQQTPWTRRKQRPGIRQSSIFPPRSASCPSN